jgi:hypothetical protein
VPLLETIAAAAAKGFGLTSFLGAFDEFFNRVTLLLSGNGNNLGSNSTFTDYSSDNVFLTKISNVSPGSFSPFLDNYSVYYNGSSYSQVSQNTAFQFGTGEFTIEYWVNVTPDVNIQSYWTAMASVGGVGFNQNGVAIYLMDSSYGTAGGIAVDMNNGGGGLRLTDNIDIRGTGWRHIAVTRDTSNTVRLFLDGQLRQSGTSTLNINGSGTYGCVIGISDSSNNNYFKGYISNFRTIKGTALYTSAFTPPTNKLTAVTNTSFLANQSNRWSKDLSANDLSIFAGGGTPEISSFSPFRSMSPYATTDGASYYFDGTDDKIQVGNNSDPYTAYSSWLQQNGSRTGTLETWVYLDSHATSTTPYMHRSFWNKGNTFMNLGIRETGRVRWYWYDGTKQCWIDSSGSIRLKEWNHIAFDLNGSSVAIYINGVSQSLLRYTDANNGAQIASDGIYSGITNVSNYASGEQFHVGGGPSSVEAQNYWNGYISNLRILPGTRLYTANFTPPTAPLSNVSGTRLLLKAENTEIIDATRNNNIETFGDVKISTSVKKYGSGSMVFDGSGDIIFTSNKPLIGIGTGNFTVEGWFYPTTWTVENLFRRLWCVGSSLSNDFGLNINTDGTLQYRNNDSILITSSSVLPLNSWTHVALCRNNGTTSLYFNGIFVGSTSTNNNLSSAANNRLTLGNHPNPSQGTFNGYIDDFRVSRFARYTGAFTAPVEEFKRQ